MFKPSLNQISFVGECMKGCVLRRVLLTSNVEFIVKVEDFVLVMRGCDTEQEAWVHGPHDAVPVGQVE